MEILAFLQTAPATISIVAKKLGVHPANLTRHFRILAAAGLIELTKTRDTGRNVERYYCATARHYVIRRDSENVRDPAKKALLFAASDLERAGTTIADGNSDSVSVTVETARIERARLAEFIDGINRLAASFRAADMDEGTPFRLSACVYPVESQTYVNERVIIKKENNE